MFQTGSLYTQPPYTYGNMGVGAPAPSTSPKFTLWEVGAGAVAIIILAVAARYGYKRLF